MKRSYLWAVWLWAIQAVTGLLLVVYIILHTIDNATILISRDSFEAMLRLWHEWLPHFIYIIMVLGLGAIFVVHMANGIRIASKPYKEVDVSWRHAWMLKHTGTAFWFTQVLTGSIVAIFAVWHFIVQHAAEQTTTAAQSAARVSPLVFLVYLVFLAAVTFHAFNGVRSVVIKLGVMTDKTKEAVLVGLVALFFLIFFGVGIAGMGVFLAQHGSTASQTNSTAVYDSEDNGSN